MSKHSRWLLAEIERWTVEKIISPEQADRLRQRYAEPEEANSPPWGLLVFASAGALVIGLGVILLFAYNWDEIPKFAKLALVFGAVIGTHATGLAYYRKGGWQRRLGEALMLLGTMLYGAGIWLVAQIYHINEHYPNGFLLWAIGALSLAWILESTAHALVATVLLTIWGGSEALDFHDPNFWALVLIGLGLVPLAWRRNSALLLGFVLAAIELLLIANVLTYGGGAHGFAAALALAIFLIGAARLTAVLRPEFSSGAGVMAFLGFAGFFLCSYLLSFHQIARELLDWSGSSHERIGLAFVHTWILFALAVCVWVVIAWRSLVRKQLRISVEEWLAPIALIYAYGFAAAGRGVMTDTLIVSVPFTLMLLGVAVMWMWRGCNESLLRPTIVGSLLLAAVMLARYFDLFESLASRGLAFIVLGGIFLAEAMYYRRNRLAGAADRKGGP